MPIDIGYFLWYIYLYNLKEIIVVKIDKGFVLKNFLDKVYDAKQQNMQTVRMNIKELDDLAYIIYQLMSDKIDTMLNIIENKNTKELKLNETKPIIKEPLLVNKVKHQVDYKPIIEKKEIDDKIDDNSDTDITDSDSYVLYGGTF